eukprot:4538359-Prymnesium_polylepis.1
MTYCQLKRSQSALQIWKLYEQVEDTPVIGVPPAARCNFSVPADSQLMRSQSPLGIWKGETDDDQPAIEDAAIIGTHPPPTTGSAPSAPAASALKRSQSALQILKMGRVDSCGSLADLVPQKAPCMGIA